MGQHQHPRFALIASAVLFVAGLVVLAFADEHKRFWPGLVWFFCWFLAFGYFLIWVVYRRYKPRKQPRGFDVVVKPAPDRGDDKK